MTGMVAQLLLNVKWFGWKALHVWYLLDEVLVWYWKVYP